MELFDTHLHLDDEAFAADRDTVLERARSAGVVGMVTVGTGLASCRAAFALAEQHPDVFAAIAIHPQAAEEADDEAMATLQSLATHPKVVAIGETGLDFVRETASKAVQVDAFRRHLRLAREGDLPVIIHCRDAYPELLDILREEGTERVIMHAFSGPVEVARQCAARGYGISLAGPVTYRNARRAVEVAKEVPEHLLCVETDAPVLTPEPFRGRRNEPAYLIHTVAQLAALRGVSPEEMAQVTLGNARRIYRLNQAR